jgi:hypothetical protein
LSVSTVLYPRWPPLLKIEISSNGQNCSIWYYMLKSSSLCLYSSNLGTFWLKIEQFWPFEEISIFSNGGHLGYRKVPKFELYKHIDELLNKCYGIFYELWTFADFDRLCKLEKRGDEIKKTFPSETTEQSSSLCLYSSNLSTFWLKIEQFWPFEEISIFSNGGHLGYRTALTDTILKGDHLRAQIWTL